MSSAFRGNTQNNPNHKIAVDVADAGGESTNGIVPIVVELDSESHYDDVIMSAIASQITSRTIVYSIVYSDADQRKHQSSASLAFVWGIHRGPVNSPHKWPVTRKMFPFDDVIMQLDHYRIVSTNVRRWSESFPSLASIIICCEVD